MSLKGKIRAEFKEAFKAKDEIKLSVLKMVQSEIGNAEINKRAKLSKEGKTDSLEAEALLTDDEALQVISREIKKRKDAIDVYDKAGRPELAERERAEMRVLMSYMPEQMGEDQVRDMVEKAIEQSGAKGEKEIGKVMAVLMPQVKGKADGAMVNKIVKELLQS